MPAQYPWQEAIIHFARLMGFIHMDDIYSKAELKELNRLHKALLAQKMGIKPTGWPYK